MTLEYIEQTHVAVGTYQQRLARRDAFLAGMKPGSFILVPRGVSQTAACDGTLYQIMPENCETLPATGVLPVQNKLKNTHLTPIVLIHVQGHIIWLNYSH